MTDYVEGDINQRDDAYDDDLEDAELEDADDLEDEDEDADDEDVDGDVAGDDEADDDEAHGGDAEADDDEVGNRREPSANRVEAALSTAVLTHIATSLAEVPDAVSVATDARGRRVTLSLNVAQQDMGRVIGRRGRTAQAIRALVAAAGAREGVSTSVDIVD